MTKPKYTKPSSAERLRKLTKDILIKKVSVKDAIVLALERGETKQSAKAAFAYWGIKEILNNP